MCSRPTTEGTVDRPASPSLVLVADDDAEMRALLVDTLRRAGFRTQECGAGSELLVELSRPLVAEESPTSVDLIISDNRMSGMTGLEVMELAEIVPGYPPTILITAFGDARFHAEARCLGAVAVFNKPFDMDELLGKVREVLQQPPGAVEPA
jgi:CheY-like chemotaxis protein